MESRDGSQASAGARQPKNEIRKEVHRQELAEEAQAVSTSDANSQALIRRRLCGVSAAILAKGATYIVRLLELP
jgi:hypothetical protein